MDSVVLYGEDKLVRAAARVPGLAPDERAVLVHLADCVGQGSRRASKSVPQLAHYARISQRQVYRVLAELHRSRLISVVGKTTTQVKVYELTL